MHCVQKLLDFHSHYGNHTYRIQRKKCATVRLHPILLKVSSVELGILYFHSLVGKFIFVVLSQNIHGQLKADTSKNSNFLFMRDSRHPYPNQRDQAHKES
jgi:hypothetical protein